ncbi:MAG: class I SAM-dependent methyltransferase family protein [Desulfurococcales archaeon]|nr:class I SAM-dependent methyltransferase family protein [Desulfurococcales archaeon]
MRLLRRIAGEVLGPVKARHVWGRIDVVGDIALIKSPSIAWGSDPLSIEDYKRLARALLERIPYIRSVWLLRSPVSGEKLLREALHLAGEARSVTIYKEHGCEFEVDILKVFVTPRLNYEHRRIAELVSDGEVVVNMFAGAGLFSVIIACRRRATVYSIDISPDAYELMMRSVELNRNRLKGRVIPILGDAARVVESRLRGIANRVLMPYPRLALEYLPYALEALQGSGVIHVYIHVPAKRRSEARRAASTVVSRRLEELGRSFSIKGGRVVRPVGPTLYQVVVDAEVGG